MLEEISCLDQTLSNQSQVKVITKVADPKAKRDLKEIL